MGYKANRRVETSAKTFALIERLQEAGPTGISEIADDLEMSKGIVHNHISTLRELGYVIKIGERYQLSAKLFSTGWHVRNRSELYQFSHSEIKQVTRRLGTAAFLFAPVNREGVVLSTYGPEPSPIPPTGTVMTLSSCLAGNAILATYPPSQIPAVSELETQSDRYDGEEVREQLATGGSAIGPLAQTNPVRSVVVPVLDTNGDCRGSVVVVADGKNVETVQRATEALRRTAEDRFGNDWESERSFATEKHSWFDN